MQENKVNYSSEAARLGGFLFNTFVFKTSIDRVHGFEHPPVWPFGGTAAAVCFDLSLSS